MYPIESYRISPNLFGVERWQAEIIGQNARFARRSYDRSRAERRIASDENAFWDGRPTLMQKVVLPLTMPARRIHDRLCQHMDRRRRQRTIHKDGGK